MFTWFTKLFGTKSERDLKLLWPYVEEINALYHSLHDLSDDALREETATLKRRVQEQLRPTLDAQRTLKEEIASGKVGDVRRATQFSQRTRLLQQQYQSQLEQVLLTLLPQAFALVKETARRLKVNQRLVVTATAQDRVLAEKKSYVTLQGDSAVWSNQWEAGGNMVVWDMLHYDVQLIGGIILHQGKIAEMATGEGKTLVATLPAFLNALAGKGVHIITVNDYLAKRDAEWMGPIYEFHGFTVDCINQHAPASTARQKAYQADVVYGTNNEFGFDYLRDNMAIRAQDLVQRDLHFAMVDEVDSVLIDDARTPLIISGPVAQSDEQEYLLLKPRVQQLYMAQRALITQLLSTAQEKIRGGDTQTGGVALFRVYRGLPKYKPLIKYLSESGIRQLLRTTENYYLQENSRMMPEADEPLLFTIDEKNNSVELTERGLGYITKGAEDPQFFVLPDVGLQAARIEQMEHLTADEKRRNREQLLKDYSVKSRRIHIVNQLLKAYALFEKDIDYILADHRVKIVDEQTGRVLEGRRYAEGLHQAIEAKEGVKVEKASQTYATITLQNYFRMYRKLAGMTGTADTEAGEFWEIYGLDVIVAPTHHPIVREDRDDKVYKTTQEKYRALLAEIIALSQAGRPVLVGTTSVEISEYVSRLLTRKKIRHQVLNAKHHQKEADIVAQAGKSGTVTIATNMAGRGTDIKLSPEAKAAGGLAIIGTERHESRRVDRQLRGRSGRQGDVGSSQFFVSLEDSLMRLFISERVARLMDRMGLSEGEVIQHSMITRSIERAQRKVEQNSFSVRKRLLSYDDVMNAQREVIYARRKRALLGEHLSLDIGRMFVATLEDLKARCSKTPHNEMLRAMWLHLVGEDMVIDTEESEKSGVVVLQETIQTAINRYTNHNTRLRQVAQRLVGRMPQVDEADSKSFSLLVSDGIITLRIIHSLKEFTITEGRSFVDAMEKVVSLYFIDIYWKEHLRAMDELKQSVQNVVYERKDPLLIYKMEAYTLFQQLVKAINQATVTFLTHAAVQINPEILNRALSTAEAGVPLADGTQKLQSTIHRNQRVTVQYTDGRLKENIKYKIVSQDVASGLCRVISSP